MAFATSLTEVISPGKNLIFSFPNALILSAAFDVGKSIITALPPNFATLAAVENPRPEPPPPIRLLRF